MSSFTVLSLSGSLRSASSNTGLIRLAQRLAPEGLSISDPYPIGDLPFYNGDLDTPDTLPSVVAAFRAACAAADAVLIAAPEYNYGPSGVLKNAIDWATRPMGAHSLVGTVTSVMTSAASTGGSKVQGWLVPILEALCGPVVNEPVIGVTMGFTMISPDGTANDEIETLVSARLANLFAALQQPTI